MFSFPHSGRKQRIDPEVKLTPEVEDLIAYNGRGTKTSGPGSSGILPSLLSSSIRRRILESYIEILTIPAPSGREDRLRDYLIRRLSDAGVEEIHTDLSGNLIAHLGTVHPLLPRIAFTAHMDNFMRKEEQMSPAIQGTRIVNRHSSILGGDDKVAVAGFLELFCLIRELEMEHGGVTLLFTTREESVTPEGWSYGAKNIDPRVLEGIALLLAMDVPSGKSIQEDHFAVYHCHTADPLLNVVRESWYRSEPSHSFSGLKQTSMDPYLESEAQGFIGGDATTFYRKFGKKVIDFGTGNFNEHTRREYTDLSIYLRQMEWIYSCYKSLYARSWNDFLYPIPAGLTF